MIYSRYKQKIFTSKALVEIHEASARIPRIITVFVENTDMQFTVLGGRHSVLERPLSEAKRPFILAN